MLFVNNNTLIHFYLIDFILLLYNYVFFYFQAQMPDPKTYKQHFENKHPKNIMPDELKDI